MYAPSSLAISAAFAIAPFMPSAAGVKTIFAPKAKSALRRSMLIESGIVSVKCRIGANMIWEAEKSGNYNIMSRASDEVGRVQSREPRYNNMRKNFSASVGYDITVK